jgi:hypothetical protein
MTESASLTTSYHAPALHAMYVEVVVAARDAEALVIASPEGG